MNIKDITILTVLSSLERFCFYGLSTISIYYVTTSGLFEIDEELTVGYAEDWPWMLMLVVLPVSLLVDKKLGQQRAIYIGGIMSLLGCLCLLLPSYPTLWGGLGLILIGTSFVKPSTTILIGRLFKKEDNKRALAFMIYFMGTNIGAFCGVLGIGYICGIYGWASGLIVATIATGVYLLFFYGLGRQIHYIETNQLDPPNVGISINKTILIFSLLILINTVFWTSYNLETKVLMSSLYSLESKSIWGYEIMNSMLDSLIPIWTLPLMIILFVYWYIKGVTAIFRAISVSFLVLLLAIISGMIIQGVETDNLFKLASLPLGLYALAEVIISPLLVTHVTRIADVRYSNTIYSIYIGLCYVLGIGYNYLLQNNYQEYSVIMGMVLMIGILYFGNKQIRKWSYGLQ